MQASKTFLTVLAKNTFLFRNKKIILILLIATGYLVTSFLSYNIGKNTKQISSSNFEFRNQPPKIKASQKINKNFTFANIDENGKMRNFIYSIDNVDLQDEVIIKGHKATAIKGKTFLIVNLKIHNNNKGSIEINAKDYIRLLINNNNELYASDIHNDPVKVQAISTKFTRIGFSINDSDDNLIFHIGEINGEKDVIKIHL